jgi:hypothetical protein
MVVSALPEVPKDTKETVKHCPTKAVHEVTFQPTQKMIMNKIFKPATRQIPN